MLSALLLYKISYETECTELCAYFREVLIFARITRAYVAFFLEATKELWKRDARCDVTVMSRSIFLSAHNRHARRYKNNEYRRVVIQYERHDVHVSEITSPGLVITTECKMRAGGPAPTGNYYSAA